MTFGFSLSKSELQVKIMVAPCTWNGLPQSSPLDDLSRDLKHSASFTRAKRNQASETDQADRRYRAVYELFNYFYRN